jgi:ketosteroid isomerase-like protein
MNAVDILKYGQQTVLHTLEEFPEAAVEKPGACGVWSVKDIIAHLASYEQVLVDVLSTFGSLQPTPSLNKFTEPGGHFNDTEVDVRKARTMPEVLAEFNDAHAQVMSLATQISPERLCQTGTLPWYGMEYALDDFLVYTFYGHKREHSAQIAAFGDRLRREAAVPEDALTATTIKIVHELEEALNRRDIDAFMALITDDCVFENTSPAPDGGRYEGRSAIRTFLEEFFQSTPSIAFKTEDLFASGNRCVVRWVFHWINSAGEHGHMRGVDVFHIRNGKMAKDFAYVKG